MLALREEEAETCPGCGNLMSVCRDAKTAGTWEVIAETCQPGRVAQAVAEDSQGMRGLHIYTRRTEAGHG